jgi:hypothetical protein
MLKSSWKSVEGQAAAAIVAFLLYLLSGVLAQHGVEINPEDLSTYARSATDLANVLQMKSQAWNIEILGKAGAILGAIGFVLYRISGVRTDLKKKELDNVLELEKYKAKIQAFADAKKDSLTLEDLK